MTVLRSISLFEAMLRHFEYEADRTHAAGATPRDIRALREQLGLSEPWSYTDMPSEVLMRLKSCP